MVSDPSALLLLKYGIPCLKSSDTLHLRSNLGLKSVHVAGGGGEGSAHARSAQTVNAYVLFFVAFDVKSSV